MSEWTSKDEKNFQEILSILALMKVPVSETEKVQIVQRIMREKGVVRSAAEIRYLMDSLAEAIK